MKYRKPFVSYFTEKRWTKASTMFEKMGMLDRVVVDGVIDKELYDVLSSGYDVDKLCENENKYRDDSLNAIDEILCLIQSQT